MFSNKFHVGIVYMFKVGFIRISLKLFGIRSNMFFFKYLIPIFWQIFCCLILPIISTIFFSTKIDKFKKIEIKKMSVGGRGA
jgi:hypothetical protein